uniref:Small ribosomal subunit protein bS18c n=2 Tax=Ostreobium TaxID=121087 RepID=A0A1A8H1A8_9CHLO|nr:Ribosomal protein S18 [Ostreobium quekettii]ANG44421.1 ribosomal protein S18 [Ostreobium sp. OS1B]SBQ77049.1 Ribosomal protein S18 [Ostreobium quekettii]
MKSFDSPVFSFSKNNFQKQTAKLERLGVINYKNIFLLRKYISIEGKILPRRLTNLNSKQQRDMAKAIKNARIMGFLPFARRIF